MKCARWLVVFVALHGPEGGQIKVNPDQVTSLRHGPPDKQGIFTDAATCLINLADGKFVTVTEDCETVRQLLEQAKR
jgi:hypothetical protein